MWPIHDLYTYPSYSYVHDSSFILLDTYLMPILEINALISGNDAAYTGDEEAPSPTLTGTLPSSGAKSSFEGCPLALSKFSAEC